MRTKKKKRKKQEKSEEKNLVFQCWCLHSEELWDSGHTSVFPPLIVFVPFYQCNEIDHLILKYLYPLIIFWKALIQVSGCILASLQHKSITRFCMAELKIQGKNALTSERWLAVIILND